MTQYPTREQVARALALVDSLVNPPMSGRYGRYADAVLALFPDPSTGDAEAEAERRWPEAASSALAYPVNALREFARSGFLAGAAWQAQQPREVVTTAAELDAAWRSGAEAGYRYGRYDQKMQHAYAAPTNSPYRPEGETP